jgi:hypothetical protein
MELNFHKIQLIFFSLFPFNDIVKQQCKKLKLIMNLWAQCSLLRTSSDDLFFIIMFSYDYH